MTHKVHPKIYRTKEVNDWSSRGFYKDFKKTLEEDFKIREFLKEKLGKIGIEKIEIERLSNRTNIIISTAKPGLVIGRGGEGVENLRKELEKKLKINNGDRKNSIRIEIREVKNPWASAILSAQWISQQLEKRVPYKKVIKQALSKIEASREVKGARIEVAGRLDGNEIARRDWLSIGRLPRQTIRADIDYARAEAYCTYGVIGVKVWLYKGEKF